MEYEVKAKICRLCLEACDNNFNEVDEVKRYMLETLNLQLEQSLNGEELVCESCTGDIKKCFDIKMSCQYIKDSKNSFSRRDNSELDLTEIYLKRNQIKNHLLGCYVICRFCLEVICNNWVFLCDESKEVTSLKVLLSQYFPELNLNKFRNLAICAHCQSALHFYGYFMKKLMDKKIATGYHKIEDTNSQIVSQQITIKDMLKCEMGVDFNAVKKVDCEFIKVDLKIENANLDRIQENTIPCPSAEPALSYNIKTETNFHDKTKTLYRCESCLYTTELKFLLKDHILGHQNVAPSPVYHCEMCKFKTKRKRNLQQHLLVHENRAHLKCDICDFQTKCKGALKQHMLVHRDSSEVTMYRCEDCSFQTKYNRSLTRHRLFHHDSSKARTYECTNCDYKTKHKGCLTRHTLIHQEASDVKGYLCEICGVVIKRKDDFQKHTSIHLPVPDTITMFNCLICKYKTKHKDYLKRHAKVHEDVPRAKKYLCDLCGYKAIKISRLKKHMVIHKAVSEVTSYRCCLCEFQTKYKLNLKMHMVIHKDPSKLLMYRCKMCSFETKYKSNLKIHVANQHNLKKEQLTLTDNVTK